MRRFLTAFLLVFSLRSADAASGKMQYEPDGAGADMHRTARYGLRTGEAADSTAESNLGKALEAYLNALDRQPVEVKSAETDFIILSCTDPQTRQNTAREVYRHFAESKTMGDEAVAIHVYDNWFATGELTFGDDALDWAAKFHAAVNRLSLIGNPAPPLALSAPDGEKVTIPETDDGRFKIMFFYDTGCAKCRAESALLRDFLERNTVPAVLYAIYAGSEREKWTAYMAEYPGTGFPATETIHLHDPAGDSGMDFRYGIVRTPGMFLISPNGTILGRKLDTNALESLFGIYAPKEYGYGSDEAMQAFRQAFLPVEKTMGCDGLSAMAGQIASPALAIRDTALYKRLTGDLLYFATNRREHDFKCGTESFVDKYILGRSDIWNTAEDTLRVVSLAALLKDLSALSPVGSKLPKIKLPAHIIRHGKEKAGTFRLDRQKNAAVIFHTNGCAVCEKEKEAAKQSFMTAKKRRILLVDMDELCSEYPEKADSLFGAFDLSGLPFILETDGKGRVADKYVSFIF